MDNIGTNCVEYYDDSNAEVLWINVFESNYLLLYAHNFLIALYLLKRELTIGF